MEIPNAFIGRKSRPTAKEIEAALGSAAPAWDELVNWLIKLGIACKHWNSISPKYGWSLRPALKSRTIVYLAPCESCFRVSFVLGDRAVAAVRSSDLPKAVLNEVATAKKYAEGTGVRLIVRTNSDLEAVRKLVEIKMQN